MPRLCAGCWNLQASKNLQKPLFFQWQHTSGLLAGEDSDDVPPTLRGEVPRFKGGLPSFASACFGNGRSLIDGDAVADTCAT